ncbi:MAG: aspartate carbamoyltransferase catalytic subunit [Planctomycetes bacterium]|nr:aspartate carbamoyltransferase catalytic subunit [Planctomycetota bacterium]
MWDRKHLLGIAELSAEEITEILDKAQHYTATALDESTTSDKLRGKRVALMFFENSTRTRVSFELAAQRLGASVTAMQMSASSVAKGESLRDTVLTVDAMGVDFMVVRHSSAGAPHQIAGWVSASVLNAGDGTHEHPTQALLDMLTIRRHKNDFDGLRVGIVGDIAHSRVARSDLIALKKLGADVVLIGPPTLVPGAFAQLGAEVAHNFDNAIHNCDVLYMLRIQCERLGGQQFPSMREYCEFYRLDGPRMRRAKPDVLVMHPGPMNRGIEIAADVADGPNAVVLEQVANGVAVRMALLDMMNNHR